MEVFFKLKERKTTVKTEVFAGITTFMTMAYILIVNPSILADAGMDSGAVFTATAISSFIATVAMGLMANYPFALAPGMGLNAYFAYTVAVRYGWQMALLAVFMEGLVFIAISFFNVRETIFNSIPKNIKFAVSVGIGLFITFIGLQNAGIVVSSTSTGVTLGNVTNVTVALSLIGVIITIVFVIKKVMGALLWGILITYVLGIICQLTGLYVVDPAMGVYNLLPERLFSMPPSVSGYNLFAAVSNLSGNFNILDLIIVVFAFLFVDIFDTIGTLIGVSTKTNLVDKDGKLPKIKEALLADAIGTTVGAVLGTSTVTTFVESAAGVSEGGRTGLTSLVTGCLFLVSLFFFPIFGAIPSFATAPALIVVGLFMVESVAKINFSDFSEGMPAFLTIVMMPFAYSISEGLVFGMLSYVIIKLIIGKAKELNAVMYILAVLFLMKLILG